MTAGSGRFGEASRRCRLSPFCVCTCTHIYAHTCIHVTQTRVHMNTHSYNVYPLRCWGSQCIRVREHDQLYTHTHVMHVLSACACLHTCRCTHIHAPPPAWPMRRNKTGSALDSDMNKSAHPRGNKRHAGEDRKTGEEKGGLCPL